MSGGLYDVIVIGAGHAGCEAALAAARMGCRSLLLTINLDNVALMPCNPSIGGPAKGHLVREIDALGGEMARNIDRTFIQIRMLNTGKGPAVQALRAQADKRAYQASMRRTLDEQPGLDVKQALVDRFLVDAGDVGTRVTGVVTETGAVYRSKVIVLTTGTSLHGRLIIGESTRPGGRAGEFAAMKLSHSLRELGFRLIRLKTGTPPRIDARTVDFSKTEVQPGSDVPLYFSYDHGWGVEMAHTGRVCGPTGEPNPIYPDPRPAAWRRQLPCYLVHTNATTHEIIRRNLHRAPLFTGVIEGVGPRYCPSIEDKVVRFAEKETHGLFLEPEGWNINEMYVQGANTSLPEDVQLEMLRSIPGLERAEIMRTGYAVEYYAVQSSQIHASLETKLVAGLFLAGQINGTSGYEEAAAQGLIAGINAALKVKEREPIVLRRDQAYIGVMIDDLVTKDIAEPYRLLTSRAEYRLLLRQDSADIRLSPIGREVGLIDRDRHIAVCRKQEAVERELSRLHRTFFGDSDRLNQRLETLGITRVHRSMTAVEFLRRQDVSYATIRELIPPEEPLDEAVAVQVEVEAKYSAYFEKQRQQIERVARFEQRPLSADLDYDAVVGLRNEAREKLKCFQPMTVGQASRISGVTPADISVLLVHLEKRRRGAQPSALAEEVL